MATSPEATTWLADLVVAVDADHLAIEHLYRALKAEPGSKILPLVGNLTDPSPGLGWRHLWPMRKARSVAWCCSCPDWATMCKHVAAVLYGVGARLDHEPEMLFTLRGVEPAELVAAAVTDVPTTRKSGRRRLLKTDDMSSVFGIDLDIGAASDGNEDRRRTRRRTKTLTKKATTTRAVAARKKPASRTKATKKRASARSTSGKEPTSKSTQAAATRTAAEKSGTGDVD